MPHTFNRKRQAGRGAFSWTRTPLANGGLFYRLYLRDLHQMLHFVELLAEPNLDRQRLAQDLREARHRLRDRAAPQPKNAGEVGRG